MKNIQNKWFLILNLNMNCENFTFIEQKLIKDIFGNNYLNKRITL